MGDLFYGLTALLFAGYAAFAGFDLGATALARFLTKTRDERALTIAAIGPYWDASEVWLIAGAGTFLLGFPRAFSAVLSGFYLTVFFATWALVMRGLSIELRHQAEDELWHDFLDGVIGLASAALIVLLGATAGNLVRGVPLEPSGTFSLQLFGAGGGVLDGFTLATALVALVLLLSHGATFLAWKTDGPVGERASTLARALQPLALALWAGSLALTKLRAHLTPSPVFAGVCALAMIATLALTRLGRAREAFIGSAIFTGASVLGVAATLHPMVLRGTRETTLFVEGSAAADSALAIGARWWFFGLALVVIYFANLFRTHRGKTRVSH